MDVEVKETSDDSGREKFLFQESREGRIASREIIAPILDAGRGEHAHITADYAENISILQETPQEGMLVKFLGVGDALSEGDVTNFLVTTADGYTIAVDTSLEAYYNLKRLGVLPQVFILTHNHADHNAGTIQLILDALYEAKAEAEQVGKGEDVRFIIEEARDKLNQHPLIMHSEVKEDLAEIISQHVRYLFGEDELSWEEQARILLADDKVEEKFTGISIPTGAVYEDNERNLEIIFHRNEHPISTYGFTIVSPGGNIGYVVDTQNIEDFWWAVRTLEREDPEGRRSMIISENGVEGIHLSSRQLARAAREDIGEYLQTLVQNIPIHLVHSSDTEEPGWGLKRAERFTNVQVEASSSLEAEERIGVLADGRFPQKAVDEIDIGLAGLSGALKDYNSARGTENRRRLVEAIHRIIAWRQEYLDEDSAVFIKVDDGDNVREYPVLPLDFSRFGLSFPLYSRRVETALPDEEEMGLAEEWEKNYQELLSTNSAFRARELTADKDTTIKRLQQSAFKAVVRELDLSAEQKRYLLMIRDFMAGTGYVLVPDKLHEDRSITSLYFMAEDHTNLFIGTEQPPASISVWVDDVKVADKVFTSSSSLEALKGGIDLNPRDMHMEIEGEGITLPAIKGLPFDLKTFEGFTFQILSIKKLKSLRAQEGQQISSEPALPDNHS